MASPDPEEQRAEAREGWERVAAGWETGADAFYAGTLPLLGGVDRARFRREAKPGDDVELRVEVTQLSARAGRAHAVARVRDTSAVDADLLFVLARPEPDRWATPPPMGA